MISQASDRRGDSTPQASDQPSMSTKTTSRVSYIGIHVYLSLAIIPARAPAIVESVPVTLQSRVVNSTEQLQTTVTAEAILVAERSRSMIIPCILRNFESGTSIVSLTAPLTSERFPARIASSSLF